MKKGIILGGILIGAFAMSCSTTDEVIETVVTESGDTVQVAKKDSTSKHFIEPKPTHIQSKTPKPKPKQEEL